MEKAGPILKKKYIIVGMKIFNLRNKRMTKEERYIVVGLEDGWLKYNHKIWKEYLTIIKKYNLKNK